MTVKIRHVHGHYWFDFRGQKIHIHSTLFLTVVFGLLMLVPVAALIKFFVALF